MLLLSCTTVYMWCAHFPLFCEYLIHSLTSNGKWQLNKMCIFCFFNVKQNDFTNMRVYVCEPLTFLVLTISVYSMKQRVTFEHIKLFFFKWTKKQICQVFRSRSLKCAIIYLTCCVPFPPSATSF